MYEKITKQMTPGIRMMVGGVLLLVGIIWQLCSRKTLDMYAFYMMAAAMLCFTNVIMSKLTKATIDPIRYLLLNLVVMIAGFAVMGSGTASEAVKYSVLVVCFLAAWFGNAVLIKCDGVAKRIVMGLVAVLFNILLIGTVFMIPVLMAAFNPKPVPV